jgi:hypothetical protein
MLGWSTAETCLCSGEARCPWKFTELLHVLLRLVKVHQMHCFGQQNLCDGVELLLVLPPTIATAAMLAMAGILGKCSVSMHKEACIRTKTR